MNRKSSGKLLDAIRGLEQRNPEIEFEYVMFDNGFYVNLLAAGGIGRVTCGSGDYVDIESIDNNSNTISCCHVEDVENTTMIMDEVDAVLEIVKRTG